MSELKPCPFCGKEPAIHVNFAICVNDDCEQSDYWTGLEVDTWNTRPIEDALNARIAELEAAQRWIPVSERLPEPYTRVLACIKSGYMEVDYMYSEPIVDVGSADFNSLDNVTHWMPLPTPPEVQE